MRLARILLPAILCLTLTACVSSLLIGSQLQNRLMWALLKPLVGFDPNQVNLFEIPQVQDRMKALLGENYQPAVDLLRTADRIQQEGALIYVTSRVLEEVVKVPLPTEVVVVQEQVEQIQKVQEQVGQVQEQVAQANEQVEEAREQVEQVKDQVIEVKEEVAEIKEQVQTVKSAAGMVWNGDTNQLAVLLVEKGVSKVFAEQPQGGAELDPVWPTTMQPLLELEAAKADSAEVPH